ncbi:MAG TPA: hypothetical protein VI653_05385, partial [Steroidobacteraceae bacterium]
MNRFASQGVPMVGLPRCICVLPLLIFASACQREALPPQSTISAPGALPAQASLSALGPASGHILFVRILPPSARWVFKMDGTGANVTKLANGYAPAWKPDGSRIAFNCGINICVMNSDGSGIVHLTTNVLAEEPAWSASSPAFPDGRIAFDQQDASGNWHIYVMTPDGGNVTQVTTDPTIDGDADWSPDASRIVFQRYVIHGTSQIFVMNADGTGLTQLTTGGGSGPAWSPDGTQISFDSNRSGTGQIYLIPSSGEGSGLAQVTTGG